MIITAKRRKAFLMKLLQLKLAFNEKTIRSCLNLGLKSGLWDCLIENTFKIAYNKLKFFPYRTLRHSKKYFFPSLLFTKVSLSCQNRAHFKMLIA